MSYLVLVRHGESEWNARGLWAGLTDISLTQKGIDEAKQAAEIIKDIKFDVAFTSKLKRAKETLDNISNILNIKNIPIFENEALNERDYGEFTGKNKWGIKKEIGEEKFLKLRRGWDYPVPQGETLKDVYNRVVPYYLKNILPELIGMKNILVVAHGNSLRALIKYLEKIHDLEIQKIEMGTGEIYVYKLDDFGNILSKEKRAISIAP